MKKKRKVLSSILVLMFAFTFILPSRIMEVKAETQYIVVDDTQTQGINRFVYNGGFDPNPSGGRGWSTSNGKLNTTPELLSQHWTWTTSLAAALPYTYTFEFEGTGVELVGIKSRGTNKNTFILDGGQPQIIDERIDANDTEGILYEVKNLTNGKHSVTVSVTNQADTRVTGYGLQVSYARVFGTIPEPDLVTTVNCYTTEGVNNKFIYTGTWSGDGSSERWTAINTSIASDLTSKYYEIQFTGNKIEVYGLKNATHGNVKFIVDNVQSTAQVFDAYSSTRTGDTLYYTASGLSEGVHTLKATAVSSSGKAGRADLDVKYAKVYHKPYGPAELRGSIVDTNTHYDQSTYSTIENLNKAEASLWGWKGDKAISQIALIAKNYSFRNVRVQASDFTSNGNIIGASNIAATFLKETEAYIGDPGYHSASKGPGSEPVGNRKSVPDVLYTTGSVNIDANKVQPIWLEFNIPQGTAAGIYNGIITITAEGYTYPLAFRYSLEVLDAVMPAPSEYDFDVELWQYPYSSAEYYNVVPFSVEHFNILRPHMLKYKELGGHAITTTIVEEAWGGQTYSANPVRYPSMVKWTKAIDGTFKFNFTDFDKWVEFNKGLGIGDKIICYSMIPWGNKISYFDEATQKQTSITVTAGTTAYEQVWTQFLRELIAHVDAKGWFDDVYIGIDERPSMNLAFDVIDKVKGKNGKSLKKSAAMDHFDTSYKYITDRVDDLSVGSTAAKGNLAAYKSFVQERKNANLGYNTTIYTCTEHFPNSLALSMPGESYWTMLFTAAQGGTGYLRWAYDAWVKDPLRDTTHWAFEAGDTFLIYPDEKGSVSPVSKSSVRLEKIAEGIRDVNKLYFMAKKVPALQTDINDLLATVRLNYTGTGSLGATYASADMRAALPVDMAAIKEGIKNISKKYIQALNDAGKVAYYSFDNITGTAVEDQWNNYDGILTGAQIISGMSGSALQFNRDSDNLVITNPATVSGKWTTAFWVKKGTSSGTASILWDGNPLINTDKGSESIDILLGQGASPGNMGIHVKEGFSTYKYTAPSNEWIHMAVVNTGTELKLYINGVTDVNKTITWSKPMNAPIKIIGGRNFVGAIDEVKIYSRALSQAEVLEAKAISAL